MEQILIYIFKSNKTVFSFKELFLISGDDNPNLFRKRLHYYVKKGQLYSIRRGLYAKDKKYNKRELATKIFTPSYISLETVLAQSGIIFQYYSSIFVVTYQTRELVCDEQIYIFKKIKGTVLTNNSGIEDTGTYYIASKERAFLDALYLNKDFYFDNLLPLDFNKMAEIVGIYKNKRLEKQVAYFCKKQENDKE